IAANGVKTRKPPKRYSAWKNPWTLWLAIRIRSRPVSASSSALTMSRSRLRASAARSRARGSDGRGCARWRLRKRPGVRSGSDPAVLQHVRGGDLLQRGGAVHLVPEEALLRGEQEESIRRLALENEAGRHRQPRAELGDLVRFRVDPARARVEIADDARDLPE